MSNQQQRASFAFYFSRYASWWHPKLSHHGGSADFFNISLRFSSFLPRCFMWEYDGWEQEVGLFACLETSKITWLGERKPLTLWDCAHLKTRSEGRDLSVILYWSFLDRLSGGLTPCHTYRPAATPAASLTTSNYRTKREPGANLWQI